MSDSSHQLQAAINALCKQLKQYSTLLATAETAHDEVEVGAFQMVALASFVRNLRGMEAADMEPFNRVLMMLDGLTNKRGSELFDRLGDERRAQARKRPDGHGKTRLKEAAALALHCLMTIGENKKSAAAFVARVVSGHQKASQLLVNGKVAARTIIKWRDEAETDLGKYQGRLDALLRDAASQGLSAPSSHGEAGAMLRALLDAL